MTEKSPSGSDKAEKNKISSMATAGISFEFTDFGILMTKHEILKENHEILIKNHKSLETHFQQMSELNKVTELQLSSRTKKLEAEQLNLFKELEKERSEKEEFKKEMERKENEIEALRFKNQELLIVKQEYKKEMERKESENEALRVKNQELLIVNEECTKEMERKETENEALRVKNQELLIAKEKEEEELNKLLNKFAELEERCALAKSEYSSLKSLFDSKNHTGLAQNNLVILLSDDTDSDAEKEKPPLLDVKTELVDNTSSQNDVDAKPFHQSESKPKSSEANHLELSSSSSSSSDGLVLVQLPAKRSRDVFNKYQ